MAQAAEPGSPLYPVLPGPGFAGILSALPDFAMAALAVTTWLNPERFGHETVSYLVLVVLLEFIVVHSAGFMGQASLQPEKFKKIGGTLGLGLFYTVFVGAMSLAFKKWWPLVFFWGLTLNRLLRSLTAPKGSLNEGAVALEWGSGAVFYLFSAFAGLLPWPALGLKCGGEGCYGLTGGGIWIDRPQSALFSCALYFFLQGIFKIAAPWLEARLSATPSSRKAA